MAQDYYETLGISRTASGAEIKSAYRQLARQFHPDLNGGDVEAERRFKEINEAYTVLSDDQKRQAYDRHGSSWKQQNNAQQDFNWSGWFGDDPPSETSRRRSRTVHSEDRSTHQRPRARSEEEPGSFSDLLNSFFGDTRSATGSRRTYSTRSGVPGSEAWNNSNEQMLPVEITLEEAFWGTRRTIQQGGERFDVSIPRGVDSGSKVRVGRTQGLASSQLTLQVAIKPHERLMREGDQLRALVRIDLYTLLLGGEVQVPTIEGALMLVVPANTQNGRIFRLKGQGMPMLKAPEQRGDLLVEVQAELPVPLREEEQRRFSDLRRLRSDGDDLFS